MGAIRSMGSTLTLVGEGSEEDLVLGNIASIGEVATDSEEIDATTLDSPDGAREFIQGSKDSGELSVELNNVFDGTVETLNSVFDAGETRSWTIGFVGTDGTTVQATLDFDAFVKGRTYGESTPDGLHKATVNLRISGAPVYSEGSV
jgi:hypothetical protein